MFLEKFECEEEANSDHCVRVSGSGRSRRVGGNGLLVRVSLFLRVSLSVLDSSVFFSFLLLS